MLHYHIRWSRKEFLDWEAHPSRAEADARAKHWSDPVRRIPLRNAMTVVIDVERPSPSA